MRRSSASRKSVKNRSRERAFASSKRRLSTRKTATSPRSPTPASARSNAESPTTRPGIDLPSRVPPNRHRRRHPRAPQVGQTPNPPAIETKLTTHPFELGKPLRYSLRGARRLRVGDYRVIYRIEPPDAVLVVKIGHRREVYEE
ncbi:MAG: type II toxin-antitoxin system RelE/ParE family toxin [Deltaproteobacteria bacterium]|nr:type II toxin-antitoxin system RelE/ParE family toxin [Deltaproteobacteria bacterium]